MHYHHKPGFQLFIAMQGMRGGSHLIQQEDARVAQQRSGDGNALLLAPRHLDPLLPNVRVIPAAAPNMAWKAYRLVLVQYHRVMFALLVALSCYLAIRLSNAGMFLTQCGLSHL